MYLLDSSMESKAGSSRGCVEKAGSSRGCVEKAGSSRGCVEKAGSSRGCNKPQNNPSPAVAQPKKVKVNFVTKEAAVARALARKRREAAARLARRPLTRLEAKREADKDRADAKAAYERFEAEVMAQLNANGPFAFTGGHQRPRIVSINGVPEPPPPSFEDPITGTLEENQAKLEAINKENAKLREEVRKNEEERIKRLALNPPSEIREPYWMDPDYVPPF